MDSRTGTETSDPVEMPMMWFASVKPHEAYRHGCRLEVYKRRFGFGVKRGGTTDGARLEACRGFAHVHVTRPVAPG